MKIWIPFLAALACAATLTPLRAQGDRPVRPPAEEAHARIRELAQLLRADKLDGEAQARARELVAELQAIAARHEAAARDPEPRAEQTQEMPRAPRSPHPAAAPEVPRPPVPQNLPQPRVPGNVLHDLHEQLGLHFEVVHDGPMNFKLQRRVSEPAATDEPTPSRNLAARSPHAQEPVERRRAREPERWPAHHPDSDSDSDPIRVRAPAPAAVREPVSTPVPPAMNRRSPDAPQPATPPTDAELRSVVEDLRSEMAEVRRLVREIRELAGKHHEGPMLR